MRQSRTEMFVHEHCRPTVIDPVAYWLSVAWLVVLLWLLMSLFSPAHAQPTTVVSSIRHTRRMTRITVLKPARVAGRSAAGFPLRQAINHGAEAVAYGAGTVYRVSGLIPSGSGIIANILFPRW